MYNSLYTRYSKGAYHFQRFHSIHCHEYHARSVAFYFSETIASNIEKASSYGDFSLFVDDAILDFMFPNGRTPPYNPGFNLSDYLGRACVPAKAALAQRIYLRRKTLPLNYSDKRIMSNSLDDFKFSWIEYWNSRKILRNFDATIDEKRRAREVLPPSQVVTFVGLVANGFLLCSVVGAVVGGKTASRLFKAENIHVVPRSRLDMFRMMRERNYKIWLEGMRNGAKLGSIGGLYLGSWYAAETMTEFYRQKDDMINTAAAGIAVGFLTTVTCMLFCNGNYLRRVAWNWRPLMVILNTTFPTLIGLSYRSMQSMTEQYSKPKQINDSSAHNEIPAERRNMIEIAIEQIEADMRESTSNSK